MKKNILLLLAFVLSNAAIFAKGIDVNYAMQVAQNFYQQTTGNSTTLTLAYQSLNTDASNGLSVGEPIYYVFNAGHNSGFVMVSADDLARPILGYDTKGQFVIEKAPPVIADWFAKYSRQIIYAKVNSIPATQATTRQWNNYYNNISDNTKGLRAGGAVAPLLTTTWDQGQYYNDYVPADASAPNGYNGHCPTGCGATAMSQIMKYWQYPAQGTGNNSYTSNYGTLSANFAGTTYNWANMPNSVTSTNADVATIMYDAGVAVDMTYQSNESLSYMVGNAPSCQAAYTTYFGYDPGTIQGLIKANYANETDWTNLIQTELNNNRPVQYAGSGPEGGHTFVLDGSDGAGNFHVNWGWSGTDNGYYGIDALDPSPYANGTFDQNESMLIGIQPLNVTVTATGINLYAATVINPNPIPFLTTFTVTTNVINNGTSAFTGAYCAVLFDSLGNFIRFIGDILNTGSNALPVGNYYLNGLTFSDTTVAVTVPGLYVVGIFYQTTGANTWSLVGASTYTNPVTVQVQGPQDAISVYSNITASPTTLVQGQGATISANLFNNGTTTYTGQYEAVLLDLDGNYVEQLGTYNETSGLPVNYDYQSPIGFTTNTVTAPEGQYILAIAEEASGTSNWYYCGGQIYKNPVLIYVVNPGIVFLAVDEVTGNSIKVYPNPASDQITIETGAAEGNYALKVFNTLGQLVHESNGILSGQKLTTDVSAFAAGMYTIQLKTESGSFNSKFIVK